MEHADTELGEHIPKLLSRLSDRERQLVKYFATGYSNIEISLLLGIAATTVKIHRSRTYKKMGVQSLKDLMNLLGVRPSYCLD